MTQQEKLESYVNRMLKSASVYKRFPVYRNDLERFIAFLYLHQPIDLWDLIHKIDMYIRTILSLLYVLERNKFVSIASDGKLHLTRQGTALARHLSVATKISPFARRDSNLHPELSPRFRDIAEKIRELNSKIAPQNRFDQAPLMPEASVRKAAYAINRADVAGKSIACVGDDDLISIVLALSGTPTRILAIDIDKYLLEAIEEFSEKNNMTIETLQLDLREPIPPPYRNSFDLFITEPPDTVNGITLFVSRGVELLKQGEGMIGYVGISPTACPPRGLLQIQQNFAHMALLITDRLPKYSDYPPHRTELKHIEVPDCYDAFYPPQKVWYSADLVRVRTSRETASLIEGNFKGRLADYRGDSQHFQ